MAFNTYTELQAEIAGWLNRGDLGARIPSFIALAETQIKRRLRRTKVRATVTLSARATTLPLDCQELVALRLTSGIPGREPAIPVGTPEQLADWDSRWAGATGQPQAAAIVGRELLVAPAPNVSYTAEVVYFQTLTPLGTAVESNSVLVEAPDAYLFGALKEAEPFLENDDRAPMWASKFNDAIDDLNIAREREELAASLHPARLPMVF